MWRQLKRWWGLKIPEPSWPHGMNVPKSTPWLIYIVGKEIVVNIFRFQDCLDWCLPRMGIYCEWISTFFRSADFLLSIRSVLLVWVVITFEVGNFPSCCPPHLLTALEQEHFHQRFSFCTLGFEKDLLKPT